MSYLDDDKNPVTPFAVTNHRDKKIKFGIKKGNRRGHMLVIGKTGTGKSTLLENMISADLKIGNGLAVIDPHGDLAENILNFVPEERINDVIYFNPADLENPIPFNPLEKVRPDFHHLVASGLISVFKKLWPDFWGPRLEHILRHSILTLLEYPGSTLLDLPRILTNSEFRKNVVANITNPQVKDFWLFEFEKYSAWMKSEAVSPILNKVGQFLTSLPIRNILGQKENTFKLRKVLDEKKILIVNLAKGKIGEDNCSLLGALMVTRIKLAALSRANISENERGHFYFYVDEFHNFLTLSFSDILSESRKYGLNLILAHQYIEQIDEKIRASVFGNVGTMISFRVGAEDAKYLSKEFQPVFTELDLINLPNYHIYLRLMIDGVTSRAFSATSLPPEQFEKSFKEKIIEESRKRYGKPRKEVEKGILFKNYWEIKNKPFNQKGLFS
jgi:type IV secretory pathway TraG/TraD family ATPase VirD4